MLIPATRTLRALSAATSRAVTYPLPLPSMPLTATRTLRAAGIRPRASRIFSTTFSMPTRAWFNATLLLGDRFHVVLRDQMLAVTMDHLPRAVLASTDLGDAEVDRGRILQRRRTA